MERKKEKIIQIRSVENRKLSLLFERKNRAIKYVYKFMDY